MLEFPFRIRFESEKAVDTGESVGTCFLLSGKAYCKNFEGKRLVVPCITRSISLEPWEQFYLMLIIMLWFRPIRIIRIAFPVITLGTEVDTMYSHSTQTFFNFFFCSF